MTKITDAARSPGDPTVIRTGPSSRSAADNMGKRLGWFSIGLGLVEIFAARRLARALGIEGRETLLRAMGVREILSGVTCLSTETTAGVWSRVAGDAVDMTALLSIYAEDNPKRANVGMALAAVMGVTLADLATANALTNRHWRGRDLIADYDDRTGWPRGVESSRGAASDFQVPDDMRPLPAAFDKAPAATQTGATAP